MKKIFACLLFTFALLFPVEGQVYAADEELTYSEYMDEVAGMFEPQWTIHFNPEFNYKYDLGIFGIDRLEGYKKWNIKEMYYAFVLNNEHDDKYSVGYNVSDLSVSFDYEFYSLDEKNVFQVSTASFTYLLSDFYSDSGDVAFTFDYEDIMSVCDYYVAGCPTLIHSVKITLYSHILNKCGTSVIYDFEYLDNDFSRQICSGISFYEHNEISGTVFKGENYDIYRESDTSFDYFMYTLVPGSSVDAFVGTLRFIGEFVIAFPGMIYSVITFLIDFFILLPEIIHVCLPFLPTSIIDLIMFGIGFSFLAGIYYLYKKMKG